MTLWNLTQQLLIIKLTFFSINSFQLYKIGRIILMFLFTTNIIGNLSVLIVMWGSGRKKRMRFFIMNLAVTGDIKTLHLLFAYILWPIRLHCITSGLLLTTNLPLANPWLSDLFVAIGGILPELVWNLTVQFYAPDIICRLVKYMSVSSKCSWSNGTNNSEFLTIGHNAKFKR